MKSLFRWLLILGVAAAAVYAITTMSRRRATAPAGPEWAPPVVEPPLTAEDEGADDEAMAAPAPVEEAVTIEFEVEQAAAGAPGVEEEALGRMAEAAMETQAEEVTQPAAEAQVPEPAPEAIERAETEGMTPPPEQVEDIPVASTGEALVSEEMASAEPIEPTYQEIADAEAEGMHTPMAAPAVDIARDEVGELVEASIENADADVPDFGTMIEAAVEEAERAGSAAADAQTPVEPEAPAGPAAESQPEPPPEKDFLTTYFEELAATPVAEEEQPGLLASVEEALTDLEPAAIVPPPRRTAESYLDEGNVYFNVGQYGLAIERYTQAIELDRELTAAFYNRANARTRSGDFEGALSDYDRALELQPNDADALNNRGMLHLYRANYAAALRDFNGALAADATDTTVMVNRGLAHLHSGDAAGALVDFQEAIRLDSRDAAAHYGAAQAAAAIGNKAESLRFIQRTLELDPAYAREAAADPRLESLQGDEEFLRLLRQSGSRSG